MKKLIMLLTIFLISTGATVNLSSVKNIGGADRFVSENYGTEVEEVYICGKNNLDSTGSGGIAGHYFEGVRYTASVTKKMTAIYLYSTTGNALSGTFSVYDDSENLLDYVKISSYTMSVGWNRIPLNGGVTVNQGDVVRLVHWFNGNYLSMPYTTSGLYANYKTSTYGDGIPPDPSTLDTATTARWELCYYIVGT
jgi:hypothetical protein